MIEGIVIGLGSNQVYKKDGLERMEITIKKRRASPLSYQDGVRKPIILRIGNSSYEAGVRSTPNLDVVWICPDLKDKERQKISLARVLIDNGFRKNQRVDLKVKDNIVHILPKS